MAIYVIHDGETIAHPDAQQWLDPVKPDARLRDPEKIAASILERTIERDNTLALHPDTCRLVAWGFHVIGHAEPHCFLMRSEYEERELLKKWWEIYVDLIRRDGNVRLVGFNSLAFDLPVLLARSMWLDLDHPDLDIDRYRSPHARYDVMWHLSRKGVVKPHSLKFYAKRAGLDTLDKVEGSQIAQLVKEERWDEVEAHCLSDVGLTHSLANRIKLLKV